MTVECIYVPLMMMASKAADELSIASVTRGAASQHVVNYRTLENIAAKTSLIIDFGGGIKSEGDLNIAFESGASMVTLGSIAVKEPQLTEQWINKYGSHNIILTCWRN